MKLNLDSKTEYKLVLARRIDSAWQKNLKKKGIVQYDPFHYVWFVLDLDRCVKEYEKRINRKKPLPTEWNYEKEKNRNSKYIIPENAEYRLPTGLADVIGYNQDGHIIIVEVKVSKSDYMRDEKWRTYLNYCDEYYFLLDFEDDKVIADLRNEGTGLLTELKQTLAVTLLDIKTHRATERNMVIYSIGKALTKKYVFGY